MEICQKRKNRYAGAIPLPRPLWLDFNGRKARQAEASLAAPDLQDNFNQNKTSADLVRACFAEMPAAAYSFFAEKLEPKYDRPTSHVILDYQASKLGHT